MRFVERYQRLLAFELPKEYRVVYSRSIDMADYFRRHFDATPKTVFVSKTDHIEYDMWWMCNWVNEHRLVTRERLPWLTAVSAIMEDRRTRRYWKDPLSYEYILIEDQRRSIRFERESPNPIWWFDYTDQEHGPSGSAISHLETPYVKVVRSAWSPDKGGLEITLKMLTDSIFPDYAVVLWGLPPVAGLDRSRIRTNATEFVLGRNTGGEWHLVLFFDLEPDAELQVTLLGAAR